MSVCATLARRGARTARSARALCTGRRRVLSGIQPTGGLHVGNYYGALKQWVAVANDDRYDTFFCVVDLHAITALEPAEPGALRQATLEAAALFIAAGVDPARSNVFVQSHVSAHAELAWLLNCVTPMGWLERMTQFKDKTQAGAAENASAGLFTYPVLMAADILLYQAELVPVGDDQRQHLELTREIARRFNSLFCTSKGKGKGKTKGNGKGKDGAAAGAPAPVFTEPEGLHVAAGARVMSLQDGHAKMSKSAPSDMSRINLLDPPELIVKKIKKCKTDAVAGGLRFDDPSRPECHNLLTLYMAATGGARDAVAAECADLQWGAFKGRLADAIVADLAPLQAAYAEVLRDRAGLEAVLREGAQAARGTADRTLHLARDAMGFAHAHAAT